MALIGGRDTRDFVVWTGVDATELRKLTLKDGTTMEAVTGLLAGALQGASNEINSDPLYSSLMSTTSSPEVVYRMGSGTTMQVRSEYSRPERARGEVDGHMLPLIAYDKALGWTWDYLRNAYSVQIEADIAAAVEAVRSVARTKILTKLITKTDDSGTAKGLGSGGYSPGFATTAASTAVDFTPPSFAGVDFANTHEHYAIGGSSITSAQMVTNMKHLREHGHNGPYDLLISSTDEATVVAFTDYVAASDPLVNLGTSAAVVNLPGGYIGYLKSSYARVRVVNGWPANYTFMFKSYGANSPLNPLRVRVGEGESALRFQAFPEPNSGTSPANPLGTLIVWGEFGVGVGDRTNGVPHRNNAAWADGTAS
jgi:hypothetical protein